jgi:hypothetical protein
MAGTSAGYTTPDYPDQSLAARGAQARPKNPTPVQPTPLDQPPSESFGDKLEDMGRTFKGFTRHAQGGMVKHGSSTCHFCSGGKVIRSA